MFAPQPNVSVSGPPILGSAAADHSPTLTKEKPPETTQLDGSAGRTVGRCGHTAYVPFAINNPPALYCAV